MVHGLPAQEFAVSTTGAYCGQQSAAVSSSSSSSSSSSGVECSSRGGGMGSWPPFVPVCATATCRDDKVLVVNEKRTYIAPAFAAAATRVEAPSPIAVSGNDDQPMGASRKQQQQAGEMPRKQQEQQQQQQLQQQQQQAGEVLHKQQEFEQKVSSLLAATRAEVLGLVDHALQRTMVQLKQLVQEYGVRELGEVEQLGMRGYVE